MKLTKSRLKQLIKEELKEAYGDMALSENQTDFDIAEYIGDTKQRMLESMKREAEQGLRAGLKNTFDGLGTRWEVSNVDVEYRQETHGPTLYEHFFCVTMEIKPSQSHPDYEWVYELDLNGEDQEIGRWIQANARTPDSSTNKEDGPDLRVYIYLGCFPL
jgi:hypothetical protein